MNKEASTIKQPETRFTSGDVHFSMPQYIDVLVTNPPGPQHNCIGTSLANNTSLVPINWYWVLLTWF